MHCEQAGEGGGVVWCDDSEVGGKEHPTAEAGRGVGVAEFNVFEILIAAGSEGEVNGLAVVTVHCRLDGDGFSHLELEWRRCRGGAGGGDEFVNALRHGHFIGTAQVRSGGLGDKAVICIQNLNA